MNKKRKKQRKRRMLSPKVGIVAMMVATFMICTGIIIVSVTPPKYDIQAGNIAERTIQATRDVEDTVTKEQMIEEAVAAVSPVYVEDTAVTEGVSDEVASYFDYMVKVRDYCENKKLYSEYDTEVTGGSTDWQEIIGGSLTVISDVCAGTFSSAEIYSIAAMSGAEVEKMAEEVPRMIAGEMNRGIKDGNLEEHVLSLSTQIITDISYSTDMSKLSLRAIDMMQANLTLDEAATEAAKEAAGTDVAAVYYKTGQNVITEGEVVTKAQLEVLRELGYLESEDVDYGMYIGIGVYSAVIFTAFYWYVMAFEKKLFADFKRMCMLLIVFVTVTALALLLSVISARLTAVFLGAILAGALIKPRTAIIATLLMAFVTAPIGTSGEGAFSAAAMSVIAYTLFGGMTAAFLIRRRQHRIAFIGGGLGAGVAGGLMLTAFGVAGASPLIDVATNVGMCLLSGLIAGILTIGIMPIFEAVFKLPTPTKLLELLNPNQKLLRRLSIEAPGTYHHSTIIANLAEAAAEAIDANALLARTISYYHDIGKIKAPEMFSENQHGENPHDSMEPEQSVEVIRSHVSYGVQLAGRYGLPREITDAIAQHHGTTIMAVFYARAREKDASADPADYRYDGPIPQTVETAILMLADGVEAAVRSNQLTDRSKIWELMNKMFDDRIRQGQFNNCDITIRDFELIKQAFLSVYDGVFHERVKYPDEDKRDEDRV